MSAKPDYHLPMLPPLSFRFGRGGSDPGFTSAFDRDDVARCSRGCDALALVYRQAGLTSRHTVLMPAFHCPSIVAETHRSGLPIGFHRINPDLTPVDDDIVWHLKGGARALLLIHYFGFMQDVRRYRALCDQYDALLIEDCAHTLFGLSGELLPGETGHYAIASQRKLFPVPDGGAAIANPGPMRSAQLRPPSWPHEVRGALRTIQQAADYRTLGAMSRPLAATFDWLDRQRATGRQPQRAPADPAAMADAHLDESRPLPRESRVATRLRRATGISRLIGLRRRNYQHLVRRLQDIPGCTPLFPDLQPGTVPYVVPVVISNAQRFFTMFKTRGIPMFRWEGIGNLGCEVTRAYGTDLIQLPCHQELSLADIDWIADQLGAVMTGKQA